MLYLLCLLAQQNTCFASYLEKFSSQLAAWVPSFIANFKTMITSADMAGVDFIEQQLGKFMVFEEVMEMNDHTPPQEQQSAVPQAGAAEEDGVVNQNDLGFIDDNDQDQAKDFVTD